MFVRATSVVRGWLGNVSRDQCRANWLWTPSRARLGFRVRGDSRLIVDWWRWVVRAATAVRVSVGHPHHSVRLLSRSSKITESSSWMTSLPLVPADGSRRDRARRSHRWLLWLPRGSCGRTGISWCRGKRYAWQFVHAETARQRNPADSDTSLRRKIKQVYRRRYKKSLLVARRCHVGNDLTNFTGDSHTNEQINRRTNKETGHHRRIWGRWLRMSGAAAVRWTVCVLTDPQV